MAKKGALSVWETIVVHLARFSRFADELDVPAGVTQEGVAEGSGVTRAHAALELGKLVAKGRVVERLAHVRGARTKKKVYFLTSDAYKEAAAVRDKALATRVTIVSDGGRLEVDGRAALQRLTGALGFPEARSIGLLLSKKEIDERELRVSHKRESSAWPVPDLFVGRADDIAFLQEWLKGGGRFAVITGMQGIGKSSLAAKAFGGAGMPTLWHRASALDSAERFSSELARFAGNPCPTASSFMQPDPREVAAALSADPRRRLVVVAGYSHAAKALDPFMAYLKTGTGPLKVVLCCDGAPGFYGMPEKASGSVIERALGGLGEEETAELLRKRGISGAGDAKRLHGMTGGHPMALALVRPGSDVDGRDALRHLLRDVLGRLSPDGFEALSEFSVHRSPVPASASAANPATVGELLRAGMLVEDDSGKLGAHGVVRAAVASIANPLALRRHHSSAADFHLNSGNAAERLFHLWMAGRKPEAARHLRMHKGEIMGDGNVLEALAIATECCLGRSDEMDELVAELSLSVGDSGRALEISRRLSSSKSKDISSRAGVRTARLLLRQGDLDGARKTIDSTDCAGGAEGLRVLGGIQRRSGEYELAARTLQRALSSAKKGKDWRLAAEAANELGVISLDLGDSAKARKWLDEASRHAVKAGERGDAAVILANVALTLAHEGDAKAAASKFSEAMGIARKAGLLRLEAAVATNLAHLHMGSGALREAKRAGERAVQLLESLGDVSLLGAARINLGRTLVKMKDPSAGSVLEAGIADSMRFPESGLKGQRLLEAAKGLTELGEVARAKAVGVAAAKFLREVGDEEEAREAEAIGGGAVRKG
jgi:tetratricopeptide (TPR) repeat protein